jgi:hypothetical protein
MSRFDSPLGASKSQAAAEAADETIGCNYTKADPGDFKALLEDRAADEGYD